MVGEVRDILRDVLQLGECADSLDASSPLFGAIPEFDSMAVVTVLMSVEEKFRITIEDDRINQELNYREEMWAKLESEGGPKKVSPSILRNIGIYGGAQGIWVDKARTAELTADGTGLKARGGNRGGGFHLKSAQHTSDCRLHTLIHTFAIEA